jgi:hypothetical protein
MTEEFGGIGANEYVKKASDLGEQYLAAIESDRGTYAPLGFSLTGSDDALATAKSWKTYLDPLGAGLMQLGYSGTDVEGLSDLGAVTFGFIPVSDHYFDVHHSALDQLSAVDSKSLEQDSQAIAVLTYLLAELGI